MVGLILSLCIVLICLWFFIMYSLWKKEEHGDTSLSELSPVYTKSARTFRKLWFKAQRGVSTAREVATIAIAKAFFFLFPKARKAFEQKDELTGLHHGPSSYFLKTISEDKEDSQEPSKKNRRKRKNV